MPRVWLARLLLFVLFPFGINVSATEQETLIVKGLQGDARIQIDEWGVPHIYAQHHYDAFFVQGFNAARDRLWQIDLWRRRGLGKLSEVLGPNFVEQDKAARLFLYRGSMFREWLAYGSDAKRISTAFTQGINAYIDLIVEQPERLPLEFRLLGYAPEKWQASDPVRIRSNGLWRNILSEVQRANIVCKYGLEVDAKRKKLSPAWKTVVPEGLDPCSIPPDVVKLYALAQAPVDFRRATLAVKAVDYKEAIAMLADNIIDAGSNNWAISPSLTVNQRPILANDPHRGHAVPSLRYIAHLVAPGLNVIGAGEPALPGISIGHNEKIAFGLTIFSVDQEDLVVYKTRGNTYRYKDRWQPMREITESILVKNAQPVELTLQFTRDGPIIYQDARKRLAFAVRAAWLEPGMAPYFGSIEYMRAENWDQFLAALNRWGAPSENQVYADIEGNIGYKPAGLTPIRKNYDGLMPIPGDGRYEWYGFYDMDQLPVSYNPESGYVATANAMSLPDDYPYKEKIIGFEWAEPWRIQRIQEVLESHKKHDLQGSIDLQRDYVSLPARRILTNLDNSLLPAVASELFTDWQYELEKQSSAAALFEIWLNHYLVPALMKDKTGLDDISKLGRLDKLSAIEHLESLTPEQRQKIANATLRSAIIEISGLLGADYHLWKWGDLHKMRFQHPLYHSVGEQEQRLMAIEPVARGGSGDTLNSTRYRQDFSIASGGSWRMVVDVGNWDAAVMTNAAGQSGEPGNIHYDDMLKTWAEDGSMPLLYSREKVNEHTRKIIYLRAAK